MANLRSKIFNNFLLYCAHWTLNLSGEGVEAPTFFGHAKFEVKNFLEFFQLQSTVDSELFRGGGSRHQLFLVMLHLKSKFFRNFLITEYSGF